MKKIYFCLLLALIASASVFAQTTYLPLSADEYELLDRLETFSGELNPDFVSTLKPVSRKEAVAFLSLQNKSATFGQKSLSAIDQYQLSRALSISGEWIETADGDDGALDSKNPILKYFYQKQPDLLHVHMDNFFLVVNPVLYLQASYERNRDGLAYINLRGAEFRGRIGNRIGFYTMLGDNQEKLSSYMESWQSRNQAAPGNDYYAIRSGVNDIFTGRGYFDFNAVNDRLNVTFGYDKNFIGDGMRSLFLSDVGAAATFLRLRSKFWKLHYQNLFMELTSDYIRGYDRILPKKYATMHQLNGNITRWLNLGIFESTVFAQENKFNAGYLIPVIFYRTLAQAAGGTDKTALGLNFKAIALKKLQLYGQGYFNSINISGLGKGDWSNQYGIQLGLQYFDAFTLSNLDIRGEMNIVRPFTYATQDSVSNYTHYNQALAHPMEASFAEWIVIARYQPLKKLCVTTKGIIASRGTDSSSTVNFGGDIARNFDSRTTADHYGLISGTRLNSVYMNLNVAYEIRPNIFLEAGGTHLRGKYETGARMASSTILYGALRWNISRKEYDYF